MKLYEVVKKAKEGDDLYVIKLINDFNPLLKKYAYQLNYEEAHTDLIIGFIESFKSIVESVPVNADDPLVIFYIQKKIYYKKIDLFRKNVKMQYESIPVEFIEEFAGTSEDTSFWYLWICFVH